MPLPVHRDAWRPRDRGWNELTPTERWEHSSLDEMLAMSLHVERGEMVLDDLRALPSSPLVIAEGSVLPASAAAYGTAVHAVWLMPATAFQDAQIEARSTPTGPARLQRALRDVIAREVARFNAPSITVDETTSVAGIVSHIERRFRTVIESGPRARSIPERRQLLVEINDAIVQQVRGYYAQPWATGTADPVLREFVCECALETCEEFVLLPVGELALRRPLLAHPHA